MSGVSGASLRIRLRSDLSTVAARAISVAA